MNFDLDFLIRIIKAKLISQCMQTPTDDCWPSIQKWNSLNRTVNGHLIANEPLAKPCYDGLEKNPAQCQKISKVYQDSLFREASPIGFTYPVVDTCAPINGSIAGSPVCDLGSASVYSVNTTKPADVAAGIKFAKENNLRLVIKNTGHDTVGAVGGYLQGGGHGPVSHDFGLATDQVLELKVVLASGALVTASACENIDLFTALRGGGGGTFGVVISATIKVHPTRPVLKHSLTIASSSLDMSALTNASVTVLSKYPILADSGFSGNAQLNRILGTKSAYSHNLAKLLSANSSSSSLSTEIEDAKRVINTQLIELLEPFNGTKLTVISTFEKYDTFKDYFDSGIHESPALNNPSPVIISRFFDKSALVNNHHNLTTMFQAIFPQSTSKVQAIASLFEFCLIGGGEVLTPQPNTAVHPSWRKTYMFAENFDVPSSDSGIKGVRQVRDYATSKKLPAMKVAAPGTGTYLNEADPYDPDWKEDFYGSRYNWLYSVKQKYDPDGVFWCYSCVGSEGWEEITGPTLYGPLCEKK
ncbi:unnamed protein product [Penicillium salamii]|nr:unnamed protein product [Penicillium salamii]CAG8408511.1 unnamed protein product [Penicillium salamii]